MGFEARFFCIQIYSFQSIHLPRTAPQRGTEWPRADLSQSWSRSWEVFLGCGAGHILTLGKSLEGSEWPSDDLFLHKRRSPPLTPCTAWGTLVTRSALGYLFVALAVHQEDNDEKLEVGFHFRQEGSWCSFSCLGTELWISLCVHGLWQTHSKHYPQWWKIESISPKVRNKTRVPTLTTTIQHSFGSFSHSNQSRKRNKKESRLEKKK